jgi:hypothetical protein
MRRIFQGLLAVWLAAVVVAGPCGCGDKPQGQPNPDLKVPDVPPSDRSDKGPLKAPGKK